MAWCWIYLSSRDAFPSPFVTEWKFLELPRIIETCENCYSAVQVVSSLHSFFLWGGTYVTRYCGHFWSYCTAPDDRWGWLWSNWWNEDWQGKSKYSEKTCPSAILSNTNPTWPDPGANPGRRGGKPANNRLSYGAAFLYTVTAGLWFTLCKSSRFWTKKLIFGH
jgi:hypothetical protein